MASTMGTARGTTQGSWRPFAARTPSTLPSYVAVVWGAADGGGGLEGDAEVDGGAVGDAALDAAREVGLGGQAGAGGA